jgi:predicted aspartyl protease
MGLLTVPPMGFQPATDPNNLKSIRVSLSYIGANRLFNEGIILNVAISPDMLSLSTMEIEGKEVPQPIPCKALVDTGASGLAIDKTIAQKLGLKRNSITENLTANGSRLAPVYLVSLNFPATNLKSYDMLRATEVDLSKQPFQCLIGREIMANWHLHYNGQTGQVSISD